MPRDEIESKYKPLIWGKAAGCCELCHKPVYEEGLLRRTGNYTNLAHICAASPGGPRYDAKQTAEERKSIDNVMLLCRNCHKLIDDDPNGFPASTLRRIKQEYEDAVAAFVSALQPTRFNMIKYLASFGQTEFELSDLEWKRAMSALSSSYHGMRPYDLNPSRRSSEEPGSIPDMAAELERQYNRFLETVYEKGPIAVFALASQPLLIKLGTLIGDKTQLVCFQRHRDSEGWGITGLPSDDSFIFKTPSFAIPSAEIVLKLSMSGSINDASIPEKLRSSDFPVFELTVDKPGVCAADSRDSGTCFREFATNMLYKIHEKHPTVRRIHVLPAMPSSFNIIFGSVINTHVIPEFTIYEKRDSIFSESLTIGGARVK